MRILLIARVPPITFPYVTFICNETKNGQIDADYYVILVERKKNIKNKCFNSLN